MTAEQVILGNAVVIRDKALTHRWFAAFGAGVAKYITSFTSLPADDSTTDPTEFVTTVVEVAGTSSAVINDLAGGALIMTAAGNEDDGISLQLGNPNLGRWLSLAAQYPTYFGIQFAVNDVDQTEVLFGGCVTDTDPIGGMTDGIYFRSVDESAVLNFVLEQDSVETVTAVATLADGVYVTAEFFYTGSNMEVYINGELVTTIANTDDNFPDDELLRLTLSMLSGEATANTCIVKWVRLIQIQN